MSKTMQLTVRILPYFEKDMKSDYPKISQGLGYVNEAWVEEGPSFFDIVGRLDKLYQLSDPPLPEGVTAKNVQLQHI